MGMRETINQSKNSGIGVAVGAVLLAGLVVYWSNRPASALSTAFFTTDDGKTFFKDDIRKAAPFDAGGKQAVRAYVYDVNGTLTVRYLERYKAAALPKATELLSKNDGSIPSLAAIDRFSDTDVLELKKPGDAAWVSAKSSEGQNLRVHAGDGAKPIFN